jgi:hypothetical protein
MEEQINYFKCRLHFLSASKNQNSIINDWLVSNHHFLAMVYEMKKVFIHRTNYTWIK